MAALTTTWTEQSVVGFNAGTLADIDGCVGYVESKLKRGTLGATTTPTSTEVQTEIIRAKEELCEMFGFTWQRKFAYAACVADTSIYAMPLDYNGGPVSLRDTTNNRKLRYVVPGIFDLKWPDMSGESSNKLEIFTIKDRELWIGPPAASTYQIELEFSRSGDDSTATDVSYIPELLRFRICDYAISQSFKILHMWNEAKLYEDAWNTGLLKIKRGDRRKKWAANNYQALSWQQAYAAGYNQWD